MFNNKERQEALALSADMLVVAVIAATTTLDALIHSSAAAAGETGYR